VTKLKDKQTEHHRISNHSPFANLKSDGFSETLMLDMDF